MLSKHLSAVNLCDWVTVETLSRYNWQLARGEEGKGAEQTIPFPRPKPHLYNAPGAHV